MATKPLTSKNGPPPVPQPATIQDARAAGAMPGTVLGAPLAPPTGPIDAAPESLVVVTVKDWLKSPTVRAGLAMIALAFYAFLGYVADQVVESAYKPLPWYLDLLIVLIVAAACTALTVFWGDPLVAKVRSALIAGIVGAIGYVVFAVYNNGGIDGIEWHKTGHAAVNAGLVAIAGGLLIVFKLKDNNPANLPGPKG